MSTITPVLYGGNRKIKTFFLHNRAMFVLRSLWEGTLILFFVSQSVGNICVSYHDLPSTCPVPVWLSLMPSRSHDVSEKNGPT